MHSSCHELWEQLHSLLEDRDREFPVRDPSKTKEVNRILDLLVRDLDDSREGIAWKLDKELVKIAVTSQENAIFLCGPMKSGTTLLLAILDGHSELNVLPGDSWLWVRFSDKVKQEVFSNEEWRRHWLKRFINPTGQKPFWIFGENEQEYVSFLNYMDYWLDTLSDTCRKPVLATVFSYFCANPKHSLKTKQWVEKTPGNEFRSESISDNFPLAKFIHIVRDPRENLASIKRLYRSRGWGWDVRGMVGSLAASYDAAEDNRKKFGKDRYLLIRYEDLTADPKRVMNTIAQFLGIYQEDSLLVPTVNSQLAKANTMYKDRQVTGAVRRSVKNDRWRHELSFYEQGLIHQIRSHADEVGCSWTMNTFDHCNRLLFGWLLRTGNIRAGKQGAAE